MKVHWSGPAIADLLAIHDYLIRDSPQYADSLVARLVRATVLLGDFPRLGHRLHLPRRALDDTFRELLAPPYRILYCLQPERVHILAVVDARRQLDPSVIDRPDPHDIQPN